MSGIRTIRMPTSGIYKIEHVPTGRIYVGSSTDVNRRWKTHKSHLSNGIHGNPRLQSSWTAHGATEFVFSILEIIEDSTSLVGTEQGYIDKLSPHYNMRKIAGSQLGLVHSEEARRKMSVGHKGWNPSQTTRQRMSAASSGRVMLEETKEKLREARSGKPLSDAHKLAISIGSNMTAHSQDVYTKIGELTSKRYNVTNP